MNHDDYQYIVWDQEAPSSPKPFCRRCGFYHDGPCQRWPYRDGQPSDDEVWDALMAIPPERMGDVFGTGA